METIEARTPAELRLNEQFLAPVLKTEGNKYSLVNAHDHKCPEKMSMITTKCFNLNEIDSEVHPSAYMEVTFTEIDKKGIVGVGIGNQIFGQNNFLGHQQNSFGVFNNGTVSCRILNSYCSVHSFWQCYHRSQICMNNTSNQQSFPSIAFVAGDTIGIGVMKDSFNQRTVFFTKNGKKIGIFEWRVHTGMDCFPGVSFSKDSGVAFSVNMSGPFKCDLKQVAEPRTDKDMLSTMPVEIIEMIGAMTVTSDRRALQLREVCQSHEEISIVESYLKLTFADKQSIRRCNARQCGVALFVLAEMVQSEQELEGQVVATTLSQEKYGDEDSHQCSSYWYVQ